MDRDRLSPRRKPKSNRGPEICYFLEAIGGLLFIGLIGLALLAGLEK